MGRLQTGAVVEGRQVNCVYRKMSPQQFKRIFEATEGYTTLGLLNEATHLLESLPSELKITKEVVTLHLGILVKSGEFSKASYLAETLSLSEPGNVDRMLMVGRYRYMAGKMLEALNWLFSVANKCEHDSYFHYLTAQCHAALGDLEAAKSALKFAFDINDDCRLQAVEDPVFEALFGPDPTAS